MSALGTTMYSHALVYSRGGVVVRWWWRHKSIHVCMSVMDCGGTVINIILLNC